jgi:hypothetical protein
MMQRLRHRRLKILRLASRDWTVPDRVRWRKDARRSLRLDDDAVDEIEWLPAISGVPVEYDSYEEWVDALIAKAKEEGWDFEEPEPDPEYALAALGWPEEELRLHEPKLN